MESNLPIGDLTDYHRQRNEVAKRLVASFAKRPVSLQEARAQVLRLKQQSRSLVKKGH